MRSLQDQPVRVRIKHNSSKKIKFNQYTDVCNHCILCTFPGPENKKKKQAYLIVNSGLGPVYKKEPGCDLIEEKGDRFKSKRRHLPTCYLSNHSTLICGCRRLGRRGLHIQSPSLRSLLRSLHSRAYSRYNQ